MTLSDDLGAAAARAVALEAALAEAGLEIARLTVELADCQGLPDPDPDPDPDPIPDPIPDPEPIPGAWVPPMKAVQVPYTWPTPDATLSPGDFIKTAYDQGKRAILLNPGSYGSQALGKDVLKGLKLWCATYQGATFAGNGSVPFAEGTAGLKVGNLKVEGYGLHSNVQGGSMIAFDGASDQWFINCAIGKSKNTGYSIKGSKGGVRGGEVYDCPRYSWAGGGDDNTIQDLFIRHVGYMTSDSDKGVSKNTFSERMTVQRVCGVDVGWNGIWFDIQNQPALVEDIYFDGIGRNVVFLEVSYGGEQQTGAWKRWRLNRIGGKNPGNEVRSGETGNPVPSVVRVSATSDVDIKDVYGTGWRVGVSLINPQAHKQITGEIGNTDRKRLGLQSITITNADTPGTLLYVAALWGSAHTKYPEMKQPTGIKWVNPTWRSGDKFRDFSGAVTEAQFRAKYA